MSEVNQKIIDITERITKDKTADSLIEELFGNTKKMVEILAFVIVGLYLWKRFKYPILFVGVFVLVAVMFVLRLLMSKLGII